uniref:Uncharacterized protein n=1 Tax=Anopheles culicifacies TaxID=139723 RepID=A0A182LUN7_9DIPT
MTSCSLARNSNKSDGLWWLSFDSSTFPFASGGSSGSGGDEFMMNTLLSIFLRSAANCSVAASVKSSRNVGLLGVLLRRHCSRRRFRTISRLLVTAFASGRIFADSASRFRIDEPAAKHSAPNHNCPARLSWSTSSGNFTRKARWARSSPSSSSII